MEFISVANLNRMFLIFCHYPGLNSLFNISFIEIINLDTVFLQNIQIAKNRKETVRS